MISVCLWAPPLVGLPNFESFATTLLRFELGLALPDFLSFVDVSFFCSNQFSQKIRKRSHVARFSSHRSVELMGTTGYGYGLRRRVVVRDAEICDGFAFAGLSSTCQQALPRLLTSSFASCAQVLNLVSMCVAFDPNGAMEV